MEALCVIIASTVLAAAVLTRSIPPESGVAVGRGKLQALKITASSKKETRIFRTLVFTFSSVKKMQRIFYIIL